MAGVLVSPAMPAMLDEPARATVYRTSGAPPYPSPNDPSLPPAMLPRQVTLRDRVTIATLIPFSAFTQIPPSLLAYLCDQLNREIEKGDTYPMIEPMPLASFGPYWFANFGAVMLLGEIERREDVREGKDWSAQCLGSFYIKPNYPGRSSHVCNGGFLVTDAARGRGVGRLMGEGYLEWAPMLGYTYSVFNLVYETNVASCRIWDALGFKRIGRVKGCGNLKSYPDQLIDAIIYGRDLGPEGEDFVSEERFDKIKFYLKHGKYPNGADRAEKSRLRSAATHYKLLDDDKLMLKDKEVVSDPQRQYEIARAVHVEHHGGINKTTATIAEKHHWVRIKETVSLVIRNCSECKEMGKAPVVRADGSATKRPSDVGTGQGGVSAAGRVLSQPSIADHTRILQQQQQQQANQNMRKASVDTRQQQQQQQQHQHQHQHQHQQHQQAPVATMQQLHDYGDMPLDPQIMEDMRHHLTQYNQDGTTHPFPGGPSAHIPHLGDPTRHQPTHPTDYQALLEAGNPGASMHAQAPSASHRGAMLQASLDDDTEAMAARATAAARAAQDALVDIDGLPLGDEEDREIKRQLMVFGDAGHNGFPGP